MDEETAIINTNTRNEKIKNFFIDNKKNFISVISIILILLIGLFTYVEIKKRNKIKIANQFNSVIIEFNATPKEKTINALTNIINEKDNSYSPLALPHC